jgi:hypothetical protein
MIAAQSIGVGGLERPKVAGLIGQRGVGGLDQQRLSALTP